MRRPNVVGSMRPLFSYGKALKTQEKIFAVAPMMDWTDRHCRVLQRLLSRRARLYMEMVPTAALP